MSWRVRRAGLVGARPAGRGDAGDGQEDRRPHRRGGPRPDRPALGALVHALRRGDERADPAGCRADLPRRRTRAKIEIRFTPPSPAIHGPQARRRGRRPTRRSASSPTASEEVEVHLPYCCFPAYRADGKPSTIRVLKPDHPIARGIPRQFEVPQTEMYDEPFHVPEPDEVILEECWAPGEWFRSGMVWQSGRGAGLLLPTGSRDLPGLQAADAPAHPDQRGPLAGHPIALGPSRCSGGSGSIDRPETLP